MLQLQLGRVQIVQLLPSVQAALYHALVNMLKRKCKMQVSRIKIHSIETEVPPVTEGGIPDPGLSSQSLERGSFLDTDRRIRSWMSPGSRKALQKKATCAGGQEALMEITATEIALEAYRAASRSVIPGDPGTRSTRRRGIG
ncbi:uncharacterized protein LOC142584129 [Dermacentor variabilis]|uniref:uncharacterized protein LOC142584129 n=1 Tax=Dermacentor variabilis TaxID=34621 RepID=UPI003F5B11D0